MRPDPFARFLPQGVHGPAEVIARGDRLRLLSHEGELEARRPLRLQAGRVEMLDLLVARLGENEAGVN